MEDERTFEGWIWYGKASRLYIAERGKVLRGKRETCRRRFQIWWQAPLHSLESVRFLERSDPAVMPTRKWKLARPENYDPSPSITIRMILADS